MRVILIYLLVSYYIGLNCQSNSNNFLIILKAAPIYNLHSNKPVKFPIGYTDASITPLYQNSNTGYDISISILNEINKRIRLGFISYITQFGFTESGNELSFWTNETSKYHITRQFRIVGLGVKTGYNIIYNKWNKLTFNTGLTYEHLVSRKNVYLWREEQNNNKYSLNGSFDYSHKITSKINLMIGLSSRISLKDYFKNISYKPMRFGVNVGIEYTI